MDFYRLGNSGLKISALTYGTALTIGTENKSQSFAEEMIACAWDAGIRSFDTSNNYGFGEAEILLGKALKKYNRQEFVLATKGSWPIGESYYHQGLSRKHILWAAEQSLINLDTDYIDIYYAHRYDSETSMREIVTTFNSLINAGKIRYWATSEWPLDALQKCHKVCDELKLDKPIAEQFIYSYAVRKAEKNGIMDFCAKQQIATLGFSPLAQGLLTGKYKDGIPTNSRISKSKEIGYDKTANIYQQNRETIDFFVDVCARYQVDCCAAALQWCLRKNVLPVMGATSVTQLQHNIAELKQDICDSFWKELAF